MTDAEAHFLANEPLDAHEWRGVQQLANALGEFEPLAKRSNLGPIVAERLGLIRKYLNRVACDYPARGFPLLERFVMPFG